MTCSIGIALSPRDGDTLDELIERADRAMYNAKRGGKGAAEVFQPAAAENTDNDATTIDNPVEPRGGHRPAGLRSGGARLHCRQGGLDFG
ncbi:MAG: diguanylate cyclase [Gammaproteobacteria bacterium]|nr:diguanylate cyclase [Gammaproteobacteria bacterium]